MTHTLKKGMTNAEYYREWRKKNPEKEKAKQDRYQLRNKEKLKERRQAYLKKKPQWSREFMLRKRYNLTIAEFDKMLEEQGGKCAICFATEPGGRGSFHVDHNHTTGEVRGILCASCNLMLGKTDDNTDKLKRAIEYLEKSQGA